MPQIILQHCPGGLRKIRQLGLAIEQLRRTSFAICRTHWGAVMSELVDSFVNEITALSPGLSAAHQATIDYWAPDSSPVTIALSELGHRIVDDFNSVDRATNEAMFKVIEDALAKVSFGLQY
jgi:hypothetical protein